MSADALSCNPQSVAPPVPQVAPPVPQEEEVQIVVVHSGEQEIWQLLNKNGQQCSTQRDDFGIEQQKDKELKT